MSNVILTSAPAEDVRSIVATGGFGTVGTDLFSNREPDSPDDCVTVYDTGASKPSELSYTWEYPTVQVRVRAKRDAYTVGKGRVLQIMNLLHGFVGSVGSVKYRLIQVVNGPVPLGEDERGRPRWTFNCEIQRSD